MKRRSTCKVFRTDAALEGTLATVLDSDVLLQQPISTVRFVTLVAFELVLRLVHFHVSEVVVSPGELLRADVTFVVLSVREVSCFVFPQIVAGFINFTAQSTLVRLWSFGSLFL